MLKRKLLAGNMGDQIGKIAEESVMVREKSHTLFKEEMEETRNVLKLY